MSQYRQTPSKEDENVQNIFSAEKPNLKESSKMQGSNLSDIRGNEGEIGSHDIENSVSSNKLQHELFLEKQNNAMRTLM